MGKCKHCGEPIESIPGRRAKEFCGNNCRAKFWQKNNSKKKVADNPVVAPEKEESKEEVKEQPKPQSRPAKVSGYLAQRQQMKNGNK